MTASTPLRVVVAGGGVAALETILALRDLAPGRVAMTLVAPEDEFTYRPMSVARPFSLGGPKRWSLARVASDCGAEHIQDSVAAVDPERRVVRLAGGSEVPYDALVLAVGARAVAPFQHAITFGEDPDEARMHGLLTDLEQGFTRRVAFVVPGQVSWSLPAYELALMTAREVWSLGIEGVEFSLISPESEPLAIFGRAASEAVGDLLNQEGIRFIGSTYADVRHGEVILDPGGERLPVERVITLPALEGPHIEGVPADDDGFIPTDQFGRVLGAEDIYAAGDGTTFPVKQGGLATQQADAVAEAIAADAGAPGEPQPFTPLLRGMLLTGGMKRFLRHRIAGGGGEAEVETHALWWPPSKIAGRFLAPYLFEREDAEVYGTPDEPHVQISLSIDPPIAHGEGEPGFELLGRDRPTR